ncbi:DUF4127 family protein [Bacillaceae bacterium SIJ1]|nr:DUF4127 family protein [Litoribacterium kuwaitense]NGP46367.1 DUF4127 family protein [Litoribacterium kuwaitense]
MTTVVYVPLDERPCNFAYPQMLASMTDIDLKVPSPSLLGQKKRPADTKQLHQWLIKHCSSADRLIVSLDMLIYGGIVPSRLHDLSVDEGLERLSVLSKLKKINPQLKIDAFHLIMRCPSYNSNDEEPDYYETHGADLHLYGWLTDKNTHHSLTDTEKTQLANVQARLPDNVLHDFTNRRRVNATLNKEAVHLLEQDTINYLFVPLDDHSEYGFSSQEQRELLLHMDQLDVLERTAIHPGADEAGCILFARVFPR